MSDALAPQFVSHDFPGFTAVIPQKTPEEAFSHSPIPLGLKININDLAVLVDGSPQITLLTIYLHEVFIDVKGIVIASVFSFQPCGL